MVDDFSHLEKFKEHISSEHSVKVRDRGLKGRTARIYIPSRNLSKALRKIGLESNKTFSLPKDLGVPETLKRHFYRGAIDGDGSLFINNSVTDGSISLVSASKPFLEGFKEFVEGHIPRAAVKIAESKTGFYCLRYNGLIIPRQLAFIFYYNSSVYLDRKYLIAKKIMTLQESYVDCGSFDKETLEFLYERENNNWVSVSKTLGVSPEALFHLKKRVGVSSRTAALGSLNRSQQIEAIKNALKNSKNNNQAAESLGISYTAFFHLRKKLGVEFVHTLPDWINFSAAQKRKIIKEALDANPKSKKKAACALGVSVDFLLKQRKQLGMMSI